MSKGMQVHWHGSPNGGVTRIAAFLALVLLGTPIPARAGEPDVSQLKLRAQATVAGPQVTVADVLSFGADDQELFEHIGDKPILTDPRAALPAYVTHEQIVKRLDELGVNLSRVLIHGAVKCQVSRSVPEPQPPAAANSTSRAHAPDDQATNGTRTLADVLHTYLDSDLAELGGKAEVDFERAGQEFLELTAPPWDFRVSASGREKLGLREFRVVIRRDGQTQRKAEIFAQVRLVRPVVVARKPLNPGTFIRSDDLGVETRVFEHGVALGPSRTEEVVGQQVRKFVPVGGVVASDAIKAVDLVVRSRPVTVTGEGSAVQVRLTGVALDSGGYGDTVRIRMGDSRQDRRTLRGVVTGLGTVRLAEGNS